MTATLEDRLRLHYDLRTTEIPERGPGLDDVAVLRINPRPAGPRPHRAARVSMVIGSVAAATVLGFVLINPPTTEPQGVGSVAPSSPSSSAAEAVDALVPVQTLPDGADVSDTPVTVAASAPTDWYRLQPDLDVAWYQEPSGQSPSMLCWRTPVGSECLPDDFPGALPLLVPTAGGQTLVVTGGTGGSADATTLDVELTDGTVLSAPLARDETISWGVARYQIPAGESITAVGDAAAQASEAVDVPGRTLPPAVGLNETPVTIPAGGELSYWRWFPDLDISERQTAEGGTELCWRTPVGTGCIDDSFISPEVGIIPTDGGAILLARPALIEIAPAPTDPLAPKFEQGPPPTMITATLSDGSTVTTDVNYGDQFGVGYGRVTLDVGVTVASATSS
jgi:hypothetical protein